MKAAVYLVMQAQRTSWGRPDPETGLRPVEGIRVIASRANRPARLERDQIAVKVIVDVPEEVFAPLTPTAVVTIPTDLALRGPIGVVADDSNPPEEDNS